MDFGCQKIRCISVVERTDKREYVSKLLKNLNIPVDFFITEKDKYNSARGCLTSHISVIKDAYDKGVQRLMVFEDDIKFEETSVKYIKKVRRFLDNEEWDIFFLGGTPNIWNKRLYPTGYNNIYRGNFAAAHAYILNRSYMKKIKDIVWDREKYDTIDVHVLMQNEKSYISFPRFFYQRVIKNDRNIPTPIIALRDAGERIVTWYARNINIPVKLIVIGIIIIIIIFLFILYRTATTPTTL